MGTWSTKIDGSDTFQDIYQNFFDLYNNGEHPVSVGKKIGGDFAEMFNDDKNDCLFGLALAQWETKSLNPIIFEQVKRVIETGNDLEVWKQLGADAATLEERRVELQKFLKQISLQKEKPKRRKRAKFDFKEDVLLTIPSPDGNKTFKIAESYLNGVYHDTHSIIEWPGAGTGVFNFYQLGKFVTATWVDNQTLEIHYDKTIEFLKKEEKFYFCGDQGIIRYIGQ